MGIITQVKNSLLHLKNETAKDPRHLKRIKTVKALFAESFAPQDNLPELAQKVLSKKNKTDKKNTRSGSSLASRQIK